MIEYKIIFAGSMGAGKTTAISSLSEIDIVNTDVDNTDLQAHTKALTTVGIDYGQIIIPPDLKVGLYGTPGQERFQFMWKIVSEGALGAIILIDSTAKNALDEVSQYVDFFMGENMQNIIIGISHMDEAGARDLEQFHEVIEKHQYPFPVFEVDGREKDDVLLLVETLIATVEASA